MQFIRVIEIIMLIIGLVFPVRLILSAVFYKEKAAKRLLKIIDNILIFIDELTK